MDAPRYANTGKDCESAKHGTILIFNDIKEDFMQNGINLKFVDTIIKRYPQQSKEFVPYLSIIDVLMNNSKEETCMLLDSFSLQ